MNSDQIGTSIFALLVFWRLMPAEAASLAREEIAGPVPAELVSVVDGDTLLVTARPWPQHRIAVLVRIRGIDTPELKSKCNGERRLAEQARKRLTEFLAEKEGRTLALSQISGDKYFGRVVADVSRSDGSDAASMLLGAGLAVTYQGGKKSRSVCAD
ncbi:MAG: hypothetical protein RLZZ444_4217 [Pseudomonadota bacterium]